MHEVTQFGMKTDIKIQSISDIITNSSTEVFTMYRSSDIDTIKNIVNAILAINSDITFDDLFKIEMHISDIVFQYLWENSDKLQNEFPNEDDFYAYLETLPTEKLSRYEKIWDDVYPYDGYYSFYDGYTVSIKEGVEKSELYKQAVKAINTFDSIFDHEVCFG